MEATFEVIIIGAACRQHRCHSASKAGWSVGLIEKAQFPRRKVCGE
jgi:hypothetical protein